jgi:hypothetical protein
MKGEEAASHGRSHHKISFNYFRSPNHAVVRNHHSHRAKQRLQIVRKLAPSGIARIHGDENGTGRDERKLRPFEHEAGHARHDGALNCQDLLGDHGEHLQRGKGRH